MIEVSEEELEDIAAIREVNRRAFEQDLEANIVDALRANGAALLSLVGKVNGRVAGHIMYSPISVNGVEGAALGPMGVLPEHQRQGIGSTLVHAGSRRLKESGCPFVIVLGHAEFYPKFGFVPASTRGITCEWDVPDDVFMVLVLDESKMDRARGRAQYRHEFSSVT
jgi:putative acetyltransferase